MSMSYRAGSTKGGSARAGISARAGGAPTAPGASTTHSLHHRHADGAHPASAGDPRWNRKTNVAIFGCFIVVAAILSWVIADQMVGRGGAKVEAELAAAREQVATNPLQPTKTLAEIASGGLTSAQLASDADAFERTKWAASRACDALDLNASMIEEIVASGATASGMSLAADEVAAAVVAAMAAPNAQRTRHVTTWIRQATATLLAFGPRVPLPQNSTGRRNAHEMIAALASCRTTVADATQSSTTQWWAFSDDVFNATTPAGTIQFHNFVAEFNSACNATVPEVILAAHWDSKLFPAADNFVGACDSAVPVVLILRLMRHLSSTAAAVTAATSSSSSPLPACIPQLPRVTVMLFDGEEAYQEWTSSDSIYGARHLAARWAEEQPARLAAVKAFVLLDLLGPAAPTFHNFFPNATGSLYAKLQEIETAQRSRGARKTLSPATFFANEPRGFNNGRGGSVEDDHIPWMQRGVPVLHMIPYPFPGVWHKPTDNFRAVDFSSTTVDLYNLFAEFLLTFISNFE
jgi:glutaminyl-peptide cyclotransferase